MAGEVSQQSAPASVAAPKTRRGQASRERLVKAAVTAVADHGIKQLRVDEVLVAAGSSKSQMYHYFSDRDALVDAVVAHRCAEFLALLDQAFASVSTLDTLATVLDRFVSDYATRLNGCPIGTLASELTTGPEPARQTVIEAFDAWEGYLVSALERIQSSGDLRPELDTADLALAILAGLEGGMFLSQVRSSDRPLRVALSSALAHLASLKPRLD